MDQDADACVVVPLRIFILSMEKFIIGTKQRMTQVFDDTGRVHAATVVVVDPGVVTQVKTADSDGYAAVQLGFGTQKEAKIAKAQKGHFKDLGLFRTVREVRSEKSDAPAQTGDAVDASVFAVGDTVAVSATTKGKGYQGVVKRHNFAGGPRTHGQKHSERRPGSIGSTGPQRVFRGTRMAGRMGGARVTVKNLKVLQVDADTNTLVISGAIPGRPGTRVEIRG